MFVFRCLSFQLRCSLYVREKFAWRRCRRVICSRIPSRTIESDRDSRIFLSVRTSVSYHFHNIRTLVVCFSALSGYVDLVWLLISRRTKLKILIDERSKRHDYRYKTCYAKQVEFAIMIMMYRFANARNVFCLSVGIANRICI